MGVSILYREGGECGLVPVGVASWWAWRAGGRGELVGVASWWAEKYDKSRYIKKSMGKHAKTCENPSPKVLIRFFDLKIESYQKGNI